MYCLIINLLLGLLSESHNKYGSVVKLWLGPTQLLVSIKDPVLIKEMLLKAEDKLPLTGRAFQLAFGPSSLFSSSFDKVHCKAFFPFHAYLAFISLTFVDFFMLFVTVGTSYSLMNAFMEFVDVDILILFLH